MKRSFAILLSTFAALTASACGEKPADNSMRDMPSTSGTTNASTGVSGRGVGIVTTVDPAAGKVTIKHGPIPDAGWPAMTMSFEADPAILQGIAAGEKVQFDMSTAGGPAKVTAIMPQ